MVVSITTDFPSVPQVPSAVCPGVSRPHLLDSRYGSEARTRVSTMQCQGSCRSNYLACRLDSD